MPPIYLTASASELIGGDSSVFAATAAKAGVHCRSEQFYGMWHTFPQWSEGCGSGKPLWQGLAALQHYGDFVRDVASAIAACPKKLRKTSDSNAQQTPESPAVASVHQLAGVGDMPAVIKDDIPPLQMDICGFSAWWTKLAQEGAVTAEERGAGRPLHRRLRAAPVAAHRAGEAAGEGLAEDSALLQTAVAAGFEGEDGRFHEPASEL